jgi:hypothetical protein
MGKTVLILATAFALALFNVAHADQKKPAPKTSDTPQETLSLDYGKISYKKGPTGRSTGPTVPPKPTQGNTHK